MPITCSVASKATRSGLSANVDNAKIALAAASSNSSAKPLTPLETEDDEQGAASQGQINAAQEPVVVPVPAESNILGRHMAMATTLIAGGSILSTLCVVFTGI